MEIISVSDARSNLSGILEKVQDEPVTIQKLGRNAAVLISYAEYERLTNASIVAFQALCDTIGERAEVRGLTEQKLAEILAENDRA